MHPAQEDGREEVIVEYVSAPREYEDLVNESTESADEPVNGVSGSNGEEVYLYKPHSTWAKTTTLIKRTRQPSKAACDF